MCHSVRATGYGKPENDSTHLLYMMTVALRKIHSATYLQHNTQCATRAALSEFDLLIIAARDHMHTQSAKSSFKVHSRLAKGLIKATHVPIRHKNLLVHQFISGFAIFGHACDLRRSAAPQSIASLARAAFCASSSLTCMHGHESTESYARWPLPERASSTDGMALAAST